MVFDDFLANRQPQTSAFGLAAMDIGDLVKFFEDQLVLIGGNPWPVVCHHHAPATFQRMESDGHLASLIRAEFHRIGQQVDDDLD